MFFLFFLQKKTKLFELLFDKSSLTLRLKFLLNYIFKNNFLFQFLKAFVQ